MRAATLRGVVRAALLCVGLCVASGSRADGRLAVPVCDREWNPEQLQACVANRTLYAACDAWTRGKCRGYLFDGAYVPSAAERRDMQVADRGAVCVREDFRTEKNVPSVFHALLSQRRFTTRLSKVWCVVGRHVRTRTQASNIPIVGNATFVVDYTVPTHARRIDVTYSYTLQPPWFLVPFSSWLERFFHGEVLHASSAWARALCGPA